VKLPKTIYAYIHKDGNEEWINACKTAEDAAEQGETRRVGKYELVEQAEVELKPIVMPVCNRKRR
jgi:hypothetical protein